MDLSYSDICSVEIISGKLIAAKIAFFVRSQLVEDEGARWFNVSWVSPSGKVRQFVISILVDTLDEFQFKVDDNSVVSLRPMTMAAWSVLTKTGEGYPLNSPMANAQSLNQIVEIAKTLECY
jgi:hypothetical protein